MSGFKTKFINSQQLPIVVEPESTLSLKDALLLLSREKESLKKLLLQYGGILFRGFPISNEHDFSSVIKSVDSGKFIDYIGGDSPRNKIIEGVYTSTEAPPSLKIPLHNELSFVKNHPKHIYFYCHVAPQERGETTVADARQVYKDIDQAVKDRFVKNGLNYVSCYFYKSKLMDFINSIQRSHKPWTDVFETEDKHKVERLCQENEFSFKWNQNDWLQISQKRPAVMPHPITNEMVWFNQAHLFDFNPKMLGKWRYIAAKLFYARKHMRLHEVFFENGKKIPREDLYHILDILERNTIYFPWQKGDVMMLDNVLAMHGRAPFTGKRRVLAAMTG